MRKRRKPTIRITLVVAMNLTVALTAISIVVVNYLSARRNALSAGDAQMMLLAEHTHARVLGYLTPIARQVDILATRPNFPALSEWQRLEEDLLTISAQSSDIPMVNVGDGQGRFFMLKRLDDDSIASKVIDPAQGATATWRMRRPGQREVHREEQRPDAYDPRTRPWYRGARSTPGQRHWTQAYVFYTDQRPGITVSRTIGDPRSNADAVISADVDIIQFSQDLASVDLAHSTEIVILDEELRIIASPYPDELVAQRQGPDGRNYELKQAAASDLPQIRALALPDHAEQVRFERAAPFRMSVAGKQYLVVAKPLHLAPNRAWTIVVLVPEAGLLAEVYAVNSRSFVTSVVLLALALLVSLLIARIFNRSIRNLVAEASRIQDLDFTAKGESTARFREIEAVEQAMEGMKTGLRGFQKYLPVELVRVLLANRIEPELHGDPREVTIFFSDIEGFTPISERLTPMEMSQRLGRYLGALTGVIEAHGGTVVQYIGDAIMALWNAPLDVEDHANVACEAALACQALIPELWPDTEVPTFRTRIGIHTATVAVGHFGSPDRLYYSAIGDGVNLASRIEGANKLYKTSVALSQATAERVKGRQTVRRLDRVQLVGSHKAITLYELCDPGRDQGLLKRYEQAFDAYLDRRFLAAIELLQDQLNDPPSKTLHERCLEYAQTPPGDDWDGVWTMHRK